MVDDGAGGWIKVVRVSLETIQTDRTDRPEDDRPTHTACACCCLVSTSLVEVRYSTSSRAREEYSLERS